jgi:hypothetical protein
MGQVLSFLGQWLPSIILPTLHRFTEDMCTF